MNKASFFFVSFFTSIVQHGGSLILSLILTVIGAIWSDICLYIGLFLLALNLIAALIHAIQTQRILNHLSEDDPAFNEIIDRLSDDPKAFVANLMECQEARKELHGQQLLSLSDEELIETVYAQNLDIADKAEDEDKELEQFTGARKVVYILGLFDAEIQNGGLCQFFVNSSRIAAPFVKDCLEQVNAHEHLALFDRFITENGINVADLDSFRVFSKRGFIRQTKRYDFDAFDDRYYELPALEEKLVAYIRQNIDQF